MTAVGFSAMGVVPTAPSLTTVGTNSTRLTSFREKARVGRSGLFSKGDSMADSYRSAAYWNMTWMSHSVGIAGYALNNYGNKSLWASSGGAVLVNVLTNTAMRKYWFNDFVLTPPGSELWWETQGSPNGIFSDRLGVFSVKYPGGGMFPLMVSTNGGPWGTLLWLDGYTSDLDGEGYPVVDIVMEPNYYRTKIGVSTNTAATNIILGRYVENSQAPGTISIFMDRGGIDLGYMTNVSPKIRDPIFSALYRLSHSNVLMLWHMKEPVGPSLTARLLECATVQSNAMPDMAIAYIGTPITSQDSNFLSADTITVQQNAAVRDFTVASEQTYVDCQNPCHSMDWMVAQGYIESDLVHETKLGNQYFGAIVWNALFNIERNLEIKQGPGYVTISHGRSFWGRYVLQTSTNLVDWSDMNTSSGTDQPFSVDVPTTGSMRMFRLQWGPP